MIYDLVYGKIASVIHVAFFAYYFVWIAITPFIDTTHFSQRIFPPREYGLLIPAVILLLIVTIAFSTVSYHLVMKTGHKEKELLMAQRAAAKAAVSKGMATETRDSGAAQANPSPSTDFASRTSTPSISRDETMLHSPSSTARLAAVGGGRGHYRGGSHGSNGFGSSTTSGGGLVALKPPPSSLSRAAAVRRPVSGDGDINSTNQAPPSSSNLHGGSKDRFVLSRSAAAAALHSSNQRVGNAWAASHPQPNESACISANESTSTTGDTSKENLFSVVQTVE